jgi:hypothetical protein
MSFFISRFRGLGIALAVLAISAGAVFAAAPSMAPVSSHAAGQALTEDPGDTASPTETASPSASASESPEPTESLEPTESPEPSAGTEAGTEAAASPRPDTHGALVSTAARMPTPSGFPNHGAFVSCVAHMHVSAAGLDWTTVTPESCGIVPAGSAQPQATTHGQGASHAAAGQANGKGHSNSKHGG